MARLMTILAATGLLAVAAATTASPTGAHEPASEPAETAHHHDMGGDEAPHTLEQMREMHRGHKHSHDFESMEKMSPEQRDRVMGLMQDIGLAMPPMDAERGRHVFLEKGCIACHSVHGVGGDVGPALNAADMPRPMNAFEFAARMWRGAQAMTALQQELLGQVISLDGQDLADLVAFAHDADEQARLTKDQIPERFHALIEGK